MWEQWFQQNSIAAVRSELKSFERSLDDESRDNKNAVGSKYPELLAIADRVESLNGLAALMENHVAELSSHSRLLKVPQVVGNSSNLDKVVRSKLGCMLVSLADRSLVQQKYLTCAQAIYLCRVLRISGYESVQTDLTKRLQKWLSEGSQLPQHIYNSCLIQFELTPNEFLSMLLDHRKSRFDTLLNSSVSEAFKSVDSTTLVYEQVVSDVAQSRLSQRRLVDLPDFSEMQLSMLLSITTENNPELLQVRRFPNACYTAPENLRTQYPLESFIKSVATSISQSNVFNVSSSQVLVDMLSSIISQAQSALSVETSMAQLLDSLLPIFAEKYSTKINIILAQEPEESQVVVLRDQLEKLNKLSGRHMGLFAPELPEKLKAVVKDCSQRVQDWIDKDYNDKFNELSERKSSNLSELTAQITTLHNLNRLYLRLEGTPKTVSRNLYQTTAELLFKEWKGKRHYWGDPITTLLLDIQMLMDQYDITGWDEGFSIIREILVAEIRKKVETAPQHDDYNKEPSSDIEDIQGKQSEPGVNESGGSENQSSGRVPSEEGTAQSDADFAPETRSSLLLQPLYKNK